MPIGFIEGKELAALLRGCASVLGAWSPKALLINLKACAISRRILIVIKQSALVLSSVTFVSSASLGTNEIAMPALYCRPEKASTCVLDVRDADFAGGHIPGVLNIWSDEFAGDDSVDSIIKQHAFTQYKMIVVTCFMSQQRGPFCARRYRSLTGFAETCSRLGFETNHQVRAPYDAL